MIAVAGSCATRAVDRNIAINRRDFRSRSIHKHATVSVRARTAGSGDRDRTCSGTSAGRADGGPSIYMHTVVVGAGVATTSGQRDIPVGGCDVCVG
ncbi:MAG TPA: hypothetical protein EYG03_14380 [Planctomycetes bacterium]|nr:hypothetical protein [Fuerstiella sp.]HIK93147.1 hypothetical protein [Planctomycetota bacterium]